MPERSAVQEPQTAASAKLPQVLKAVSPGRADWQAGLPSEQPPIHRGRPCRSPCPRNRTYIPARPLQSLSHISRWPHREPTSCSYNVHPLLDYTGAGRPEGWGVCGLFIRRSTARSGCQSATTLIMSFRASRAAEMTRATCSRCATRQPMLRRRRRWRRLALLGEAAHQPDGGHHARADRQEQPERSHPSVSSWNGPGAARATRWRLEVGV